MSYIVIQALQDMPSDDTIKSLLKIVWSAASGSTHLLTSGSNSDMQKAIQTVSPSLQAAIVHKLHQLTLLDI